MTAKEAAREAWKNLKDRPLKEKLDHIWTYYRIPIIVGVACIAIVCSWVFSAMAQKETVLYGYCLDVVPNQEGASAMTQSFIQHAGIDPNKQDIIINAELGTGDASLYDTLQILSVHVAAKEVDFLLSDEKTCLSMVQRGYYGDLTQTLTKEQQAQFSSLFLYADKAALNDDREPGDPERIPIVLGAADEFTDPVPVALKLPKSLFDGIYTFTGENAAMVILPNAPHTDTVVAFLEFLLKK